MLLLRKHDYGSLILVWVAVQVHADGDIFYDYALEDYTSPMYCFQCNSMLDSDCVNIQPNDTANYHYKPCLDTEWYQGRRPFCRKTIQRIYERNNLEITIRKCGWIIHPRLDCYSVKNDNHMATMCQCFTPGCNGSSGLHMSVAAFVAMLPFWTTGLN